MYAELYYYSKSENSTTLVKRIEIAHEMTAIQILMLVDSDALILPTGVALTKLADGFDRTNHISIPTASGVYSFVRNQAQGLSLVTDRKIDPVRCIPLPKVHEHKYQFIVLEGMDGCGKSTQLKLLADKLHMNGKTVVACRDPGSTALSDELRDIVKYREDIAVSPLAEALLFSAARAQLLAEVIAPALTKGHTVVCDRFELSTYVYQGLGANISERMIRELGLIFQQVFSITPTITFVLDLSVHEALSRLPEKRDKIEQRGVDYFGNVRTRYKDYAQKFNRLTSEHRIVDASGTPEQVHERIWKLIPQPLK